MTEGASSGLAQTTTLAQVCKPMRRKVLDLQAKAAVYRWPLGASRLARKHVSFRRLQKLDSGRHGAAAMGEQSPVAAARRAIVARWRKQS